MAMYSTIYKMSTVENIMLCLFFMSNMKTRRKKNQKLPVYSYYEKGENIVFKNGIYREYMTVFFLTLNRILIINYYCIVFLTVCTIYNIHVIYIYVLV